MRDLPGSKGRGEGKGVGGLLVVWPSYGLHSLQDRTESRVQSMFSWALYLIQGSLKNLAWVSSRMEVSFLCTIMLKEEARWVLTVHVRGTAVLSYWPSGRGRRRDQEGAEL